MASHGNVVVITSSDQFKTKINEAKEAGKIVVIDFTATPCGPCKFIAPFFTELSEKYPNLVFLEVDVDLHNDLAEDYEVRAMPTFIFVKNCAVCSTQDRWC